MDDKLSIRINIAERYYPLRVSRNEEEKIRKAAKMINDKLLLYKQTYAGKEVQDFIAMVSLDFASKLIDMEGKLDETPVIMELTGMNEDIEEYLNNNKI
jgi:cell division protein ZapA